jgi:methylglutaconyl-CoA hydratase
MIGHFLENGPAAISETKMLALELSGAKIDETTFDRLVERHAAKRQSKEAAEGLASFAEKRSARWAATPSVK